MIDNRTAWTRYYESTLSTRQKKRELRADGTVPLEGVSRRSGVRVVQSEKQAPMVLRGAEKQIAEDNAQFRRYNRAKAAEYRAALAGPNGALIEGLHKALKKLNIEQPDPLLKLTTAIDWLSINQETRYVALSMIDDAIVRLREQNGLAPFDDALPGEDPTVFQICKTKLGVQ